VGKPGQPAYPAHEYLNASLPANGTKHCVNRQSSP